MSKDWKPEDNNIWPIGTRVRDKKNGKLGTIVRYSEKSGRPIAQWDDWTFMVSEREVEAVPVQGQPREVVAARQWLVTMANQWLCPSCGAIVTFAEVCTRCGTEQPCKEGEK